MTTANVANRATNSLSSAKLRVEEKNPLRSLAKAGVSLARLDLTNSFSCLGKALSDAAYNFAHPRSLMRESEAVRALHAAA